MTIDDAIVLVLIFVVALLFCAVVALIKRVEFLERQNRSRRAETDSLFEWSRQVSDKFNDIPLAMPVEECEDEGDPDYWWNNGKRPREQ